MYPYVYVCIYMYTCTHLYRYIQIVATPQTHSAELKKQSLEQHTPLHTHTSADNVLDVESGRNSRHLREGGSGKNSQQSAL